MMADNIDVADVKTNASKTKKKRSKSTVTIRSKPGYTKLSGWLLFLKERRDENSKNTRPLKFGDVSRQAADIWRELSSSDREKYNLDAVKGNELRRLEFE